MYTVIPSSTDSVDEGITVYIVGIFVVWYNIS